jgi:hypothetical protein
VCDGQHQQALRRDELGREPLRVPNLAAPKHHAGKTAIKEKKKKSAFLIKKKKTIYKDVLSKS